MTLQLSDVGEQTWKVTLTVTCEVIHLSISVYVLNVLVVQQVLLPNSTEPVCL